MSDEAPKPYVSKVDRRTALTWIGVVGAAAVVGTGVVVYGPKKGGKPEPKGYGTDPKLAHPEKASWPRILTQDELQAAAILADFILPASGTAPAATALGVPDFIDEWVSAPYPQHVTDKALIRQGLAWLDAESRRRFERDFAGASAEQQRALCDAICWAEKAAPELAEQAAFFARYRDLTSGGFYTTPAGMKDLGFVGNVPLERFDGPPEAVIKIVGVS